MDMPIGLVQNRSELRPDLLVKKELGRKGSSIFLVPCRQAVYAEDKVRAKESNIQVLGKSLSEQTLGIVKGIRQVDEFLLTNPAWKNRLLESHPEFCFVKLNGGQPVLEHKASLEGQEIRMEILRRYYPQADGVLDKYRAYFPRRKKLDDVIDALCLAIMGKMSAENGIKTIPEQPMKDSRGLFMQIVYASGEHSRREEKVLINTNIDGFKPRFATEEDILLILEFIKELAEYEKLLHEVVATEEVLMDSLFKRKVAEVVVGEYEDKPVAFALFFHNFSTFLGRPGIYLEDLYVKPEMRGKGIGKVMLSFLANLALERKCGRLEWWCLDWNKYSIEFYKQMGAVPMDEWTTFRVHDEALKDLAGEFRD